MPLVLVVNILWGMPQVQKPLKTPNSIYIKRYGVYTISYTKSRYYDEIHKISYSHTSFSFFDLVFFTPLTGKTKR